MAKQGKQGAAASNEPVRRMRRTKGKIKQRSGLGKAWDFSMSQLIRENRSRYLMIEARLARQAALKQFNASGVYKPTDEAA